LFPVHLSIAATVVGFLGVFLGTLCMERRHRVLGSILLTLIGCAFYLHRWTNVEYYLNRFEWSEMSFPSMPWLAVGGCLATVVFIRLASFRTQSTIPRINF